MLAFSTLRLSASPLLVSAASSLTDVLIGLAGQAEAFIGTPLQFNFGGSGTLRRQIEEGAPVDVFVSAASEDMDRLEAIGRILPASRRDILSNALVLVGGPDAREPSGPGDLARLIASAKILSIGNPDSVPAGRYATQALGHLGLLQAMNGRLALAGSVREVLQHVRTGSAPLGVVFLTDALSAGASVKVLHRFPPSALDMPIAYPAAAVAGSAHPREAALYLDFLRSPVARDSFARAGFLVP